jgi:chemotaxis protein MotB
MQTMRSSRYRPRCSKTMARKKKHPEHVNHERWLVSYADFITLLFAFFVVMFATSQTDKGKAQQVSDSVKKALEGEKMSTIVAAILGGTVSDQGRGNVEMRGPGGEKRVLLDEKKQEKLAELVPSLKILSEELKKEIADGRIQINMEPRGLVVSFMQAALFPSGEDVISKDAQDGLQKVAAAINRLPNPVRLEGHTDSRPIRTPRFRSNWELSAARSIALQELFSGSLGVSRDRMSIAGYADTAPIASNEDEAGRARNRRVDIVILNEQGMMGEPPKPETPEAKPSPGKPPPTRH